MAELKRLWPEDPDLPVHSDGYLQDLRIHYASGVSLKLTELTPASTSFEPVLFGPKAIAQADEADQPLDEDLDSLLPEGAQRVFAKTRFYAGDGRKAAYVLRKGEYVYIDPAVRPILGEIRRLQGSPEIQRRAFVLNPVATLRERLGAEVADRVGLERLFVQTEQFSERVAGVDVWRKPVLPWIAPLGNNQWIPEKFGLRVGDDYFSVSVADTPELVKRVEAAHASNADTVDVGGLLEPVDGETSAPSSLTVNDQTLSAIQSLKPFGPTPDGENTGSVGEPQVPWDAATQGKLFLVVRDNFDEVEYSTSNPVGEVSGAPVSIVAPLRLLTRLKAHQVDGLNWLAHCVAIGRPGALLADDMGLGKTLQAMAFMAWLQDEAQAHRRSAAPILIVAPTALLGNWQAEIHKHLSDPWLGPLVQAFGGDLKRLRDESGLSGRDIDTGRAALDSGAWRQAGVVLTTYETLRDYHFSFARTRFDLIVYDEIQKLKNPASQMTRAAKTLNASFVLGMTGTPVENRLQDLWSLMDVVAPGLLGSSRDFEKRYTPNDLQALASLKAMLLEGDATRPPYMVRRLKSDALQGLPKKTIIPYEVEMPAVQAAAYQDIVVRAASAAATGTLGKGGMLSFLAAMRGVSLHPKGPQEPIGDLAQFAADSARIESALQVLDAARAKNEKALVFVEDLEMQDRFADVVQARYGLPRRPMRINGGVPGQNRQKMVELFQSESNQFDVMILSPKAGGVGLTITAANHVVHLSRWWNPAVEDQATDRVYRIGQTKEVFVHIPLAVHPDPALSQSSFDLRLDQLMQRKRTLTKDLFLPGEANDEDLEGLFSDVSLSSPSAAPDNPSTEHAETPKSLDVEHSEPPRAVETESEEPARRPTLSLPEFAERSGARIWVRAPREPRPTEEILELFRGRTINRVTISDPYALVSPWTREAQIRFASDLAEVATLKSLVVEYAPDAGDDLDESMARRDIGAKFALCRAAKQGTTFTPVRRYRKGVDDDFHDRQISLEVIHAGGAVRLHTLLIGRGLTALYEDRWQCSVSYAPPTKN
ncbi:MAG: DEAD/DEAH box helicase [Phenylobacterium sp.]|uniref:DEAD/DEAH box helicase n=1 Tax=Phenylobacterium sp. TaxID=1871053 RepID=UPI0025DBDAEF|nr:DEAD/DEAH box helicase [Phenylobacterium sp.]MCA3752035.1 DEAD/DEAH box helicase [Phenylobacterium sp.]MCA6242426.1 DEAD/DEAH box helicase [Phenylobacterium sp.]MCA6278979.1 DEAD/DEAH box helicase [Phenylobacterium sp.]MCA6282074.1 DEAD/DEAH box helicase [Phenylobacterium sp.]MCA6295667.1 DEAD/DEAH box helicase [Phenylobacterium sp.]